MVCMGWMYMFPYLLFGTNISSLNETYLVFIVYNPAVSLIIFLTSVASLFVALINANIKSSTSPLMHIVPAKLTASFLFLLVSQILWKVIVDIYGFEYSLGFEHFLREVYSIFSLILALSIFTKMAVILIAAVLLLHRHYIGYFLSYLILLTISLTSLGNPFTMNPLHLLPGFTSEINSIIQRQNEWCETLEFFYFSLYKISVFILTAVFIVNTRGSRIDAGK